MNAATENNIGIAPADATPRPRWPIWRVIIMYILFFALAVWAVWFIDQKVHHQPAPALVDRPR